LNPLKEIDRHLMDDTDLAGPIMFCLLLGSSMLFKGKIHFGYIYGVGVVGCLGLYWLLNLMSERGIDGGRTASVLGYCLLPMILVSIASIFFNIDHWFGWTFILFSVIWCSYSASKIFMTVLAMEEQRLLIGYPVLLFYMCFALMAVF
jgi:protein YIPF5/7